MAAVNHFYAEDLTARSTNSTSFVTLISILGSALSATTNYLIVARAMVWGSNTNQLFHFRVSTADDSAIASKSEHIIEPKSTSDGAPYFFVHSFQTDASPADVILEHKTANATFASEIDQMSLEVIDLDDLGSANYFETISADPGATTDAYPTTQADEFTIAGSSLGTDEWLVLAYQRTQIASTAENYRVEALSAVDASSNSVVGTDENEGEDTAETRNTGFAVRHKASSGTPNFAIQTWTEATNAYYDRGGYAIALKTSAFADFKSVYTAGTASLTTTEATFGTITSYSPSVTADHLLFGLWNATITSDSPKQTMHIEDDAVEMRTGDLQAIAHVDYDPTATYLLNLFHQDNILSSDTSTYTLRGTSDLTTELVENRWLIILSLELAGAGPQTITGSLLARSPTFPTGVVTGNNVTVTGSLLARSPTFPTGAVNATNTLDGVLLTRSPTFPTGAANPGNVTLTGVLLTRSPTFPTGSLNATNTLDGVLLSRSPTFPTGAVNATNTVTGSLLARSPTFPTGTVTPGNVTITGSLLSRSPTFPTGSVTLAAGPQTITGILLARSPTFPIGALPFDVILGGVLLTRSGTFPTGAVNATNTLTGVLLSRSPTFPTGSLNATNTITGTLLSRSPTFPIGTITAGAVTLTGTLLSRSPTFPIGSVDQGETITGILLARSPTFPIGVIIFTFPGAGLGRGTGPRVTNRGTGPRPVLVGSGKPW